MTSELVENHVSALKPRAPLAPGSVLLDRYTVMQVVSTTDAANEYLVTVAHACPNCGVENQGDALECGFCGNALPEPKLLRLLEQRAPRDVRRLPPTSFVIGDYCYALLPDTATSPARAGPPLQFNYGAKSDTGLMRGAQGSPNEDSVGAVTFGGTGAHPNTLALFMVADGVGGAEAGEVASQLTLQILTREWVNRILLPVWNGTALSEEAVRAELLAGYAAANESLLEYQTTHAAPSGTTLTAAVIVQTKAYIVNVGDSRTYLCRDGKFAPLTRDHSYVAMLVANGLLSPEDVYSHPQRNIILSSLGDASSTPDIFPLEGGGLELMPGDQLLLCSDGLWEMVRDYEMQPVLQHASDPRSACAELVQMANAAGGTDNISVIVIRIQDMGQ